MSNHLSNSSGGHYTAFCRVPGAEGDPPVWHSFSDEFVTKLSLNQVGIWTGMGACPDPPDAHPGPLPYQHPWLQSVAYPGHPHARPQTPGLRQPIGGISCEHGKTTITPHPNPARTCAAPLRTLPRPLSTRTQVVSQHAYMLFYARRRYKDAPPGYLPPGVFPPPPAPEGQHRRSGSGSGGPGLAWHRRNKSNDSAGK